LSTSTSTQQAMSLTPLTAISPLSKSPSQASPSLILTQIALEAGAQVLMVSASS
jgi:hypothetical protein